jgi:hypothetical protein
MQGGDPMPQQTYVIHFLARPHNASYDTDVMGSFIPITFRANDKEAILLEFNSHSRWGALIEPDGLLMQRVHNQRLTVQPDQPTTARRLETGVLMDREWLVARGLSTNVLLVEKELLVAKDAKKQAHHPDDSPFASRITSKALMSGPALLGKGNQARSASPLDKPMTASTKTRVGDQPKQPPLAYRNTKKPSHVTKEIESAQRMNAHQAMRNEENTLTGGRSKYRASIDPLENTGQRTTATRQARVFDGDVRAIRAVDFAVALIDRQEVLALFSPRVSSVIETSNIHAKKYGHSSILRDDTISSGLKYIHRSILKDMSVYADSAIHQATIIDKTLVSSRIILPGLLNKTPVLADKPNRNTRMAGSDKPILAMRDNRQGYLPKEEYAAKIIGQYSDLFPDFGEDDREDLMIIPNNDYPYEQIVPYDDNGVPFEPLSATNVANVIIKHPIRHPFPQWATVANSEVWVNLWPLKDVIVNLTNIWRRNMNRLAGMTLHQGLTFLLEQLYEIIDPIMKYAPDYHRVFRLTRWYAERIVLNNTVTVLKRNYASWKDTIRQNGTLGCASSMTGFICDPLGGLITSTAPTGTITMELTNYIDGVFTFSCVINSSTNDGTSYVSVQMDGTEVGRILNDGLPHRVTYSAPAGQHEITLQWSGKMGESVTMSGFVLSGAIFQGAETELRDPGKVQGAKAIHLLVADLMKYYQDHWDQGKDKGHMIINQRKPWMKN